MAPIRPTNAEIDAQILDITAGLIAARGIQQTSVQAIADAAGYSKSGLLRRFPSKEALVEGALSQVTRDGGDLRDSAVDLPLGEHRDSLVIRRLGDYVFRRQGFARLVTAAISAPENEQLRSQISPAGDVLFEAFGDLGAGAEWRRRRVRVAAAISALTVVTLTYDEVLTREEAEQPLFDAAWNALGHSGECPTVSSAG
ncbi:TetR/AcrR family transcriptional regulator [Nocardiopsis salina]|uniref:TetR/AcrR family transcriptional regulator n=1 Tax=Nocardiopsis salina TaxID=245836 RepID=UPI00034C96DD|nr:TetR/AcrR family transcriptional regulator [Nocardiopsis salina]